ncbi:hypothetical protein SK128_015897 [Halocaridina rubra]|uniref:Bumetanide-sensitive sodium-(Potassium)-chloride cotransporter n=1 Tax=Halocaridina rubra TaxID=373956 RepID=A0AAN8ZZG6_HALRR
MDSEGPDKESIRHFSISLVDSETQQQEDTEMTTSSSSTAANLPPFPGYTEEKNGTLGPSSPLQAEPSSNQGSLSYSTFRSFRRLTREALPRLDHYRNLASIVKNPGSRQRPTIDDLLKPAQDKQMLVPDEEKAYDSSNLDNKFGWVRGVLVRCLLNIWGVILFIRLSWMVGQAGILEAIGIITCCNIVTTVTTLSMSAISTNGQIKGGGTYYMISRSLGPEFGGAIGLIFAFANAIACSMHIVGFCESMNDLLKSQGVMIFDGALNDIRLISCITLVFLVGICIVGMEWEARAQVVLLLVLLTAMIAFVIGAFIGPLNDEEIAKGFVGVNSTVFYDNLYSDYRVDATGKQQDFFGVFSVFFPACTGILAGANISGDLKDPSAAIPKGTLLAIAATYLSYIIFVLICGAATVRDATGIVDTVFNGSFTNCTGIKCDYGLQNSVQVMELMSVFGPLIYAGCFAASLSSALATLVSAPKVFQALGRDYLFPKIEWFAKGYGKTEEPYRAYVLAAGIVVIFNLVARLDSIAPIITNFFMATYALVNFSTFHASLQKNPGWRPTFKYYHPLLSLFGGLLSTAIMFMIQWWTALITFVIVLLLYVIVYYRKPDVNWGSSPQAQTFTIALNSVATLSTVEDHVKNYRPSVLVLSGAPHSRPPLLHFANSITKNMSLLVTGQWMTDIQHKRTRTQITQEANKWLSRHKIRAFYALTDGLPVEKAARVLMTNVGLGRLQPNMVLMGYKADWQTAPYTDIYAYFKIIHNAFDVHLAVGVLRVEGGLDYSSVVEGLHTISESTNTEASSNSNASSTNGNIEVNPTAPAADQESYQHTTPKTNVASGKENSSGFGLGTILGKKKKMQEYQNKEGEHTSPQLIDAMLRFTRKQPKGTIDVWWLYDDGGLTLLLPYILTTRSNWSQCTLRIFFLANKKDDLASEHRRMAELLCKFRIDFSDVVMVPDVLQRPREESVKDFNNIISQFMAEDSDEGITEAELLALKDKTCRHIRLRELLLEHSRNASLIVMTLPMPVLGTVSAPLYMAWLETLTKEMPPFLLLRGNQSSVLTFYS